MEFGKRVRRLTKKQRDALEELMEFRDPGLDGPLQASATRLHGFLTAVISGPLVPPSQWVPVVFRNDEGAGWETMRQAKRAMDLLMRFNNEIASGLMGESTYAVLIDRLGDPPDTTDLADDWCKGYVVGTGLREDQWKVAMQDPELSDALAPILSLAYPDRGATPDPFDHPDEYAALIRALPDSAVDIWEWWRTPRTVRRSTPKISANAPCPCGSGKKYSSVTGPGPTGSESRKLFDVFT